MAETARLWKTAALVLGAAVVAVPAWFVMDAHRTLARLEDARERSEAVLQNRQLYHEQVASTLRRLHMQVIEAAGTGKEDAPASFEQKFSQLDRLLAASPSHLAADEQASLEQLTEEVAAYRTEATKALATKVESTSASSLRATLLQLESRRNDALETLQLFGESRQLSAAASLRDYQHTIDALRNSLLYATIGQVLIFMGMLAAAYRGWLRPLRLDLARHRENEDRQEQLASLATLASGIAHEIRNPLTAMKARLFALGEFVEADSPAARQAQVIGGEVNRLEKLVREFLDFARPTPPSKRSVGVASFLIDVVESGRDSDHAATMTVECPDALTGRFDTDQIRRVLINLLRNASEAAKAGDGAVHVKLSAVTEGNRLRITVEDDGPGIDPEMQDRLFEPFFSRKAGGTGLGLSIARTIARQHGGDLKCESAPGKGAKFHLDLPL